MDTPASAGAFGGSRHGRSGACRSQTGYRL